MQQLAFEQPLRLVVLFTLGWGHLSVQRVGPQYSFDIMYTLLEAKTSHLYKRKIIFQATFKVFKGEILVSWRF